jgi:hypothetical protein
MDLYKRTHTCKGGVFDLQLEARAIYCLSLGQFDAATRQQTRAEHDPIGRVRLHAIDEG